MAEQPVEPDHTHDERQRRVERPGDRQRRPQAAAEIPAVKIAQQSGIQINFPKADDRRGDDDHERGRDEAPRHRTGMCHDVRAGARQQHADNAVIHTISFGAYGDAAEVRSG